MTVDKAIALQFLEDFKILKPSYYENMGSICLAIGSDCIWVHLLRESLEVNFRTPTGYNKSVSIDYFDPDFYETLCKFVRGWTHE